VNKVRVNIFFKRVNNYSLLPKFSFGYLDCFWLPGLLYSKLSWRNMFAAAFYETNIKFFKNIMF